MKEKLAAWLRRTADKLAPLPTTKPDAGRITIERSALAEYRVQTEVPLWELDRRRGSMTERQYLTQVLNEALRKEAARDLIPRIMRVRYDYEQGGSINRRKYLH